MMRYEMKLKTSWNNIIEEQIDKGRKWDKWRKNERSGRVWQWYDI